MEMQSLKLFVADADLHVLAGQLLRDSDNIEQLRIHITPEGVELSGEYPTGFFKVAFATIWHVNAAGPELHVRLSGVKVAGLPGNMLRGALMKMIRDAIENQPGLRVQDDTVIVHVPEIVRSEGIDLAIRFTVVRLSIGALVIEAG